MRVCTVLALTFVTVAAALSVASSGGTKNRIPDGYFNAAVDPKEPVTLKASHYVAFAGEGEGRIPNVQEKRLRFWVEEELKHSGATLVEDASQATYIVFVTAEQDAKEMEVTKSRPHSGIIYNSDGTWSTATTSESYQSTETYVVRRVWIDVYSTQTREPIWQGYLGVNDDDFRQCPSAWVRDLASIYPRDFEGRSELQLECQR